MIKPKKVEVVKFEDIQGNVHNTFEEAQSKNELIVCTEILDFREIDWRNEMLVAWLYDNQEKLEFLLQQEHLRRFPTTLSEMKIDCKRLDHG